jgi:RHS repeat-associated protein
MGSVNYDLAYNYTPNKNMLEYIPDYAEYFYNATGQLSEKQMLDGSNDAHFYEYNAYGQLIVVYKDRQKTQKIAEYWYDNNGNRVSKDVYNDMGDVTTTWYIRDINGNILSIYDNNNTTGTFKQSEVPVYGNNRIGVRYLAADGNTEQTLFEITDHLGNVRATFSENPGNGEPELQSKADYYPFGLKQPGASLISSYNYRFGYQGQFAEDETGETGYNAFDFRLYDPRIGRWTTVDLAGQHWSPYLAFSNNPISFVDGTGLVDWSVTFNGLSGVLGGTGEVVLATGCSSTGIGALVGAYLYIDGGSRIVLGGKNIYRGLTTNPEENTGKNYTSNLGQVIGREIDNHISSENAEIALSVINDGVSIIASGGVGSNVAKYQDAVNAAQKFWAATSYTNGMYSVFNSAWTWKNYNKVQGVTPWGYRYTAEPGEIIKLPEVVVTPNSTTVKNEVDY